jgi:ArsR family transcriptional regulator, virulence genes transcriptional regulator
MWDVTEDTELPRMAELETKAEHAALVLKSLSNKWRLLILCQLVKGETSVGSLERAIGLSQSALSQHLAVLRANKLVRTRRASQTIYYSIAGTEAPAILAALYDLFCQSPEHRDNDGDEGE